MLSYGSVGQATTRDQLFISVIITYKMCEYIYILAKKTRDFGPYQIHLLINSVPTSRNDNVE